MRQSKELEQQIKNLQMIADDVRAKKKEELRGTLLRVYAEMKEHDIAYEEIFPRRTLRMKRNKIR